MFSITCLRVHCSGVVCAANAAGQNSLSTCATLLNLSIVIGQNSNFGKAWLRLNNPIVQNSFLMPRCNYEGQFSLLLLRNINALSSEAKVESRHHTTATVQSSTGGLHTGSSASSTAAGRLKREECEHIDHDSAFSEWKILIGPTDWVDHSRGKEGSEKYRTQNLPSSISCSGVYELAVIKLCPESDTKRKLDSTSVCPVYVGQSKDVRSRLQQYGRNGDHLQNGFSDGKLFSEIFSKSSGIAYRWAPMGSKKVTEEHLLDEYDYAWNKTGNGTRRKDDILKLLDHPVERSVCYKANLTKNGSNLLKIFQTFIISGIFGIRRLQPPVSFYNDDDCDKETIIRQK